MKTKSWMEKNKHHFYSVTLILLSIVVTGFAQWAGSQESPLLTADNPPQNIILMIGDGMGMSHLYAANAYKLHLKKEPLHILTLAEKGAFTSMSTFSADSLVTDSAAAMTAMVTGVKTKNGYLSVSTDEKPLKTILEIAEDMGKDTGVVTTTRVTHATPAACASHINDRDKESEIAAQMINSGTDVILGGGWNFFYPKNTGGKRDDDTDVFSLAKSKGFTVVTAGEAFENISQNTKKVLGLFSGSHLPYVTDRIDAIPTLAQMTQKALDVLSQNPKGFFLMVEGGRIDHAAHINDAVSLIMETVDFDDAVGTVMAFMKEHPDTLLIVTADHETGGFGVGGVDETAYPKFDAFEKFTYSIETLGPIVGALSPDKIQKEILHDYGISLTDMDIQDIAMALSKKKHNAALMSASKAELIAEPQGTVARLVSQHYGFTFATHNHAAVPVPVAVCCDVKLNKKGMLDNTDIFYLMDAVVKEKHLTP